MGLDVRGELGEVVVGEGLGGGGVVVADGVAGGEGVVGCYEG